MPQVNSLNKLTGGLTASSSSTAVAASNSSDSSDAYEQNAIRLMGQAAQSARKAAQHATGLATNSHAPCPARVSSLGFDSHSWSEPDFWSYFLGPLTLVHN